MLYPENGGRRVLRNVATSSTELHEITTHSAVIFIWAVLFIVSPGTAGLSPGKFESARTSRDRRSGHGHNTRYTLNLASQEEG